jgi:hypothetical protein
MARADLLALELMIHLGECYQQQLLSERFAAERQGLPTAGTGSDEAP